MELLKRLGSILIMVALVVAATSTIDRFVTRSEVINRCHKNITSKANYQAEIIDTKYMRDGNLFAVAGKVKFQNGFGAWSSKLYTCTAKEEYGNINFQDCTAF